MRRIARKKRPRKPQAEEIRAVMMRRRRSQSLSRRRS